MHPSKFWWMPRMMRVEGMFHWNLVTLSFSGLSSEYLFDIVQCAIDFKSRSTSRGFGVSSKYSLLSLGCCHFQSFFGAILRDSKGQVESMGHFARMKCCDSMELQDVADCRVFSDLALMYQNHCCFRIRSDFFGCLNRFFPLVAMCFSFTPVFCRQFHGARWTTPIANSLWFYHQRRRLSGGWKRCRWERYQNNTKHHEKFELLGANMDQFHSPYFFGKEETCFFLIFN